MEGVSPPFFSYFSTADVAKKENVPPTIGESLPRIAGFLLR
jgi:hypothetical protein